MAVGGIVILLAGLLGLAVFGLLPLVLGGVALGRIGRSGGQLRGRGLAIAAMVLGILVLLGAPVLLVGGLFFARATVVDRERGVEMKMREEVMRAKQEADRQAADEEARRKAAEEDAARRAGDSGVTTPKPEVPAPPALPAPPEAGEPVPVGR